MPLQSGVGRPVELAGNAVLFSMNDGSKVVPCTVSAEALWQLTNGEYNDPLSAFGSVRHLIQAGGLGEIRCRLARFGWRGDHPAG